MPNSCRIISTYEGNINKTADDYDSLLLAVDCDIFNNYYSIIIDSEFYLSKKSYG